MEFDPSGKLLHAWGGPGQGYDWPQNEHGIDIDRKGFVWIGGNGEKDGQYLKFTRDGKFVLQIGKQGDADQQQRHRPAWASRPTPKSIPKTNEVYIADGYFNHRVIVFDADDRRLQAPLGRLRQDADDDEAPACTIRRRTASNSAIPSIA